MPKIEEYAEVWAGGAKYRFWEGVSVNRAYRDVTSQLTLRSAEPSTIPAKWTTIKLKPGDPAQCYLAGEKVIDGFVTARQVGYDAKSHGCQFVVLSKVIEAVNSTVEANPGEYKNYTLEQIAKAELGKLGIGFRIIGSPAGADKKFDRVNVQVGETVFELVDRLCRMRNVHMVDDADGNVVASRGDQGVVADLEEGRNILRASLIWRDDEVFYKLTANGDEPGSDRKWGDDVRANSATATNPHAQHQNRKLHILAEQPGDRQDMAMRANHEVDLNIGGTFTAEVAVQGWRRDGGSLWINDIGKTVNVYSPMLFPGDRMTLGIQGVTHLQDGEQGSITSLSLVLPRAIGGLNPIATGGPTAAEPAKPDEVN